LTSRAQARPKEGALGADTSKGSEKRLVVVLRQKNKGGDIAHACTLYLTYAKPRNKETPFDEVFSYVRRLIGSAVLLRACGFEKTA
jgi:transcription initiation factor TFIID subunit TAF12